MARLPAGGLMKTTRLQLIERHVAETLIGPLLGGNDARLVHEMYEILKTIPEQDDEMEQRIRKVLDRLEEEFK